MKMYLNGMGLRGIERVSDIHHTTVMGWIKEAGLRLPDTPESEEEPEITDLDELQTAVLLAFKSQEHAAANAFVGNKRHKIWLWTAVNHWQPGIIAWTIGDRSSLTFQLLWLVVKCWQSFWYVTDGYAVYPKFIDGSQHVVSKTYMTRVQGENTRLRHYLARLHRKTLCYSKSVEMIKCSIRLLLHYLRFKTVSPAA